MGTGDSHRRKIKNATTECSYRTNPCYAKGPQYSVSKNFKNRTNGPSSEEGIELLSLWEQICPNFDPDYVPPPPDDPYAPVCVQCLPANPALYEIFDQIIDILEL